MSAKTVFWGWVIIDLILALIGVLTWRFNNAQEVVTQVSFAATIASLLLACIAIVYSFFQSRTFDNQTASINEGLSKLKENIQFLMLEQQRVETVKREGEKELVNMVERLKDQVARVKIDPSSSPDDMAKIIHNFSNDMEIFKNQIKQEVLDSSHPSLKKASITFLIKPLADINDIIAALNLAFTQSDYTGQFTHSYYSLPNSLSFTYNVWFEFGKDQQETNQRILSILNSAAKSNTFIFNGSYGYII